jgi:hypothetical protein
LPLASLPRLLIANYFFLLLHGLISLLQFIYQCNRCFFYFNFFCNLLSSHLNRLTDFNGVVLVQNYLERTGRGSWAKQVPYLENTFIYSH